MKFLIGTLVIIAITSTWLLFDRDMPIQRGETWVSPEAVYPGETITIRVSSKANRPCPGTVARELIDSDGVTWPYLPIYIPAIPVCMDVIAAREVIIPKSIACGTVRHTSQIFYACNWIQNIWPITVNSKEFTFTIKCA